MEEYVVSKNTVIKGGIHPSIDKPYERLVLEGNNVVWGSVFGKEVVVGESDLILGNIYADTLRVEGKAVITGSIAGGRVELNNALVKGPIIARDSVKTFNSFIGSTILSPRIFLSGSLLGEYAIAHSPREETIVLDARGSIAKSYITTGNLYISGSGTVIPIIYVRGNLTVDDEIQLNDIVSYQSVTSRLLGMIEEKASSHKVPTEEISIVSLMEDIKIIDTIPSKYIALSPETKKGFIFLIGKEVIYEKSKEINSYIDLLKQKLG